MWVTTNKQNKHSFDLHMRMFDHKILEFIYADAYNAKSFPTAVAKA